MEALKENDPHGRYEQEAIRPQQKRNYLLLKLYVNR